MARVPYLDPSDLSAEDQDLLKRPINLFRALVNSPKMARAWHGLGQHIRYGTALDARVKELAILQVGYMTSSPYEFSHHAKLGVEQFGVTAADIQGLVAETEGRASGLSEFERTVLKGAREMVADINMSEATFAKLAAALPRDQLVDLIVTIGFYCGVVRVLGTLQIDVEPDYQVYLDKFPLPKA